MANEEGSSRVKSSRRNEEQDNDATDGAGEPLDPNSKLQLSTKNNPNHQNFISNGDLESGDKHKAPHEMMKDYCAMIFGITATITVSIAIAQFLTIVLQNRVPVNNIITNRMYWNNISGSPEEVNLTIEFTLVKAATTPFS